MLLMKGFRNYRKNYFKIGHWNKETFFYNLPVTKQLLVFTSKPLKNRINIIEYQLQQNVV